MEKITRYRSTVLVLVLVCFCIKAHGLKNHVTCTFEMTVDVCNEPIVRLSSQAEVDTFKCTHFAGFLFISGPDITNLEPLSSLKSVGGIAIGNNPNLRDLGGLDSLELITGGSVQGAAALTISGNAILADIDALSSLRAIGRGAFIAIDISNNPMLKNIDGLISITSLSASVSITGNASLENVDGLKNFTEIKQSESLYTGFLMISNNASLKNVDGLSALKSLAAGRNGGLFIQNNPVLTDIDGLSSLTAIDAQITGGLFIENNASLKNINGLMSVSRITWGPAGRISIQNNASLENVDGLSSIRSLGPLAALTLAVVNNPMLSRCCGLFPILSLFSAGMLDQVTISGNGSGCTKEDILAGGPCNESIGSFSLINSKTGAVVKHFSDTITLDIADPDFLQWTIRANTIPDTVGSVIFKLDGKKKHLDNRIPYELPRREVSSLRPGSHTLTGKVFSKPGGQGSAGIGLTAVVNIINSAAVENFQVVKTSGDVLFTLQEGDQINIQDSTFKWISIAANTKPSQVGYVKFYLNNRFSHIDRKAPYYLKGDKDGQVVAWQGRPGVYTIKAVPYVRIWGKDYQGTPLSLTFELTTEPQDPSTDTVAYDDFMARKRGVVSVFPNPVGEALLVNVQEPSKDVVLTILDSQGHRIHTEYIADLDVQQINLSHAANNLKPGCYYLQVIIGKQIQNIRFIKE